MKKLCLLGIGAAALAAVGFSSAASAHERDSFSFGIVLGGPVVERGYDREAAYWEHRRWEERRQWEEERRWRARERWERDRWRAEHAYWRHHDDDDDDCER